MAAHNFLKQFPIGSLIQEEGKDQVALVIEGGLRGFGDIQEDPAEKKAFEEAGGFDLVKPVSADIFKSFKTGSVFKTREAPEEKERFSRIQKRGEDLRGIIGGETSISEEDIRTERLSGVQNILNAINQKFSAFIGQEQIAGTIRGQRTRALNIGAGLAGSDFASAAAERTEEGTRRIIQAIQAEQGLAIQKVLGNVSERAREEARERRETEVLSAERELQLLSQVQEDARADIVSLAEAGISFQDFKQRNPARFADLLEQTGRGEAELRAMFVNNAPEDTKLGQATAGNKTFFFFRNPVTGEQFTEEFEMDIPLTAEERVRSITDEGQAIIEKTVTNPDGSTSIEIEVRDLKGFKRKPRDIDDEDDVDEDQIFANLRAQRLSPDILTSKGNLQKSKRDAIIAKGVPPSFVDVILDAIKEGISLDDIREDLIIQLSDDPNNLSREEARKTGFGFLDNFMQTLQKEEDDSDIESDEDFTKRLEGGTS